MSALLSLIEPPPPLILLRQVAQISYSDMPSASLRCTFPGARKSGAGLPLISAMSLPRADRA